MMRSKPYIKYSSHYDQQWELVFPNGLIFRSNTIPGLTNKIAWWFTIMYSKGAIR